MRKNIADIMKQASGKSKFVKHEPKVAKKAHGIYDKYGVFDDIRESLKAEDRESFSVFASKAIRDRALKENLL